jgi:hypothetical protein
MNPPTFAVELVGAGGEVDVLGSASPRPRSR